MNMKNGKEKDVHFDYFFGSDPTKKNNEERLWTVFIACLVASFGPFSFGYGMGYSSAAVVQLSDVNTTDLYLDEDDITWFGSLLNIGAMIGGPLGGWVIDFLGRKIALMITAIPFSGGWLLIGFGTNAGLLHAGRFFSGLGVGMASLIVPVYIAETAPSRFRGAFGAFNQIGIVSGILASYVIGYALDWRWSAIAGVGPSACLVILMFFMPETARWLLAHKKEERAEKSLTWLRGPDVKIESEINEIKESFVDEDNKMSFREFLNPSLLRPFCISMALHFFQQTTGINAVMFYCATIFQTAGFETKSTIVSILIGLIQFIAAVVSVVIIDRGGRRFLLIVGGTGMCTSLFTMGAYFFVTINAASSYPGINISWLAVTSIAVYIVGFAIAWGPCTWLIMSEIFPVRARGKASGICTLFNWFCSFVITKTFSSLLKALTAAGTFWFFGSLALLAVWFVFVFVPETKGKSLEEIQQYFENKANKSSSPAPVRETDV